MGSVVPDTEMNVTIVILVVSRTFFLFSGLVTFKNVSEPIKEFCKEFKILKITVKIEGKWSLADQKPVMKKKHSLYETLNDLVRWLSTKTFRYRASARTACLSIAANILLEKN